MLRELGREVCHWEETRMEEKRRQAAALHRAREVAMSYKCCEGVRGLKFSRRYFLKQGGVAMVGLSAMPAFLQRGVGAAPMPHKKQLVGVFQRGAADGLRIVLAFCDCRYY